MRACKSPTSKASTFVLVMPVLLYYLFRVLLPDSEGPKPLDAPPVTGHIVAERRDGLQIFCFGTRCQKRPGALHALARTQRRNEKNEQKQQRKARRETVPKGERESVRARRKGVGMDYKCIIFSSSGPSYGMMHSRPFVLYYILFLRSLVSLVQPSTRPETTESISP